METQLEEDKEIIVVLRSRLAEMEEELVPRSRYNSSSSNVMYDEMKEIEIGKYSSDAVSKCSCNVAVTIVRIVFISQFLFYCLLLNHSFPTNPNRITNCFQLFSLFTTYNYICSMRRYFDFCTKLRFASKKKLKRN